MALSTIDYILLVFIVIVSVHLIMKLFGKNREGMTPTKEGSEIDRPLTSLTEAPIEISMPEMESQPSLPVVIMDTPISASPLAQNEMESLPEPVSEAPLTAAEIQLPQSPLEEPVVAAAMMEIQQFDPHGLDEYEHDTYSYMTQEDEKSFGREYFGNTVDQYIGNIASYDRF